MTPFLLKAKESGFPAWLEATNEHARDVYAHYGFRVGEMVLVCVGSANGRGEPVEGGEGMRLWGMIYEPGIEEKYE